MNTSHLIILLRVTPANRTSFYQHLSPKEEMYFSSFSWPLVARHGAVGGGGVRGKQASTSTCMVAP